MGFWTFGMLGSAILYFIVTLAAWICSRYVKNPKYKAWLEEVYIFTTYGTGSSILVFIFCYWIGW